MERILMEQILIVAGTVIWATGWFILGYEALWRQKPSRRLIIVGGSFLLPGTLMFASGIILGFIL